MPRGVYKRIKGVHGAPRKPVVLSVTCCKNCGKKIEMRWPSWAGRRVYCSISCGNQFRHKLKADKVFDFIVWYRMECGISPSRREIGIACEMNAPTVHAAIDHLRKSGRIELNKKLARGIRVLVEKTVSVSSAWRMLDTSPAHRVSCAFVKCTDGSILLGKYSDLNHCWFVWGGSKYIDADVQSYRFIR